MALNSFELPKLSTSSHFRFDSAESSPRENEDAEENYNLLNSLDELNDVSSSGDASMCKPSFASVGTTTGLSATPPSKEKVIRPRSKTKLYSKTAANKSKLRTNASQSGNNARVVKNSKPGTKPVKSISSSSLVRIPGARPFVKS